MEVIPTKDALLALDIVAASLETGVGPNIAMNDNKDFVRISLLYKLSGINGIFSNLILDSLLSEGRRNMYSRQPYHVRLVAAQEERSLMFHDHSSELQEEE